VWKISCLWLDGVGGGMVIWWRLIGGIVCRDKPMAFVCHIQKVVVGGFCKRFIHSAEDLFAQKGQ